MNLIAFGFKSFKSRIFDRKIHFLKVFTHQEFSHQKCSSVPSGSYFITTPIFYVNAAPHVGHFYTLVLADALHRFHQMLGIRDTLFSTGTDEHGIKIQKACLDAGIEPKVFCDKISSTFKSLCEVSEISNTHFIRTTDESHHKAVTHFWNQLCAKGYIDKSTYSGWYSTSDETFVTESHTFIENGKRFSSETGNLVEWSEEDNYVFKLSELTPKIAKWAESEQVVKPSVFHELLKHWLKEGLNDISVSRPKSRLSWGIEVPNDETQTIYVWLDALVNYLTVSGYPNHMTKWPPDCQVVGKDILKFHALYWPAFLMAVDYEPPRCILCHSHWVVDDVKMSKSKGNVIDPFDRIKQYTSDGLRYFVLRQAVPDTDANYSDSKVHNYLNSELADTLGNLLSRCTSKALNKAQIFPSSSCLSITKDPQADEVMKLTNELPLNCHKHYSDGNFYLGLESIMDCLRMTNLYFHNRKPWELNKENKKIDELNLVLHVCLEVVRVSGILLKPVVPKIANIILNKLNVSLNERNWKDAEQAFGGNNHFGGKDRLLNQGSSKVFEKLR